ncbi:MAG: hypothetical protein M3R47_21310, partial [Chloroflexota bacterium]|nr:hypothetical protein [Chloroflexota bacterium]
MNTDELSCVIDLSHFTLIEKAKMLYNHVYYSELPKEYKQHLLKNKNYLKIASHKNFNPRIVEWMTNLNFIKASTGSDYIQLFIKSLEDPSGLFATVQKIRSHLAVVWADRWGAASASGCVCLPD